MPAMLVSGRGSRSYSRPRFLYAWVEKHEALSTGSTGSFRNRNGSWSWLVASQGLH